MRAYKMRLKIKIIIFIAKSDVTVKFRRALKVGKFQFATLSQHFQIFFLQTYKLQKYSPVIFKD